MPIHIVLYEPEIPANTGNIARTCLATNTTLHLIHPLGFSTENKMLKRAGLDYWQHVNVLEYSNLQQLYDRYKDGIYYYVEDFGHKYYTDGHYKNIEENLFFVFGSETRGLPQKIVQGKEDFCLRIPMGDNVRSLNLSNAVAIVLYEALRQQAFLKLT